MSTDLITYLNYMSTWDTESDVNIDKVITEHNLFAGLGDFESDPAVDGEFNTLVDMATTLRDDTIAADATQIAADAAAVASIWSFGLGMAAFAALEVAETIERKIISDKSTELNNKLSTVDKDISALINPHVNLYVIQYKANNDLIASKAPKGLDTRTCRSLLMQFLAQVHHRTGKLDAATFKKYAESARILYNSSEINGVYDALDELNLSEKTDADVQKCMGVIKGFAFGGEEALTLIRGVSIAIMFSKLRIANAKIKANAEKVGFEAEEVESSTFGMLDAVGKFVAVVAIVMSVVDVVLEIMDIADVVEQTKQMCDQLSGNIKNSYKDYFNGIRAAATAYNAAINANPTP